MTRRYELSVKVVNEGERIEYVERVCVEMPDRLSGRDVSKRFAMTAATHGGEQALGPLAVLRGRLPLTAAELESPSLVVVAYLTSGSAEYTVVRDDQMAAGCIVPQE